MRFFAVALLLFLAASATCGQAETESAEGQKNRPVRITFKPRAGWPPDSGCVTGTVILRILFKSSGEIGTMSVVKGLPNGLTASAIDAAQRMRFKPAIRDGKFVDSTKQVEFVFAID
jgi:TonB family protein